MSMGRDDGAMPTAPPAAGPTVDVGPLGVLPRLFGNQVRLDRRLGAAGPSLVADLVAAWDALIGGGLVADRFDVQWRAAGLRRPGVVAQLAWPRLRARVALGIDPPLAHAVVDRLLGFERSDAEARLQVSPVEWGVLAFVVAAGMGRLDGKVGPLGPWDLTIDRVGPDPFDAAGLGPVVTWRWRVRVGDLAGSARLWLPESLLAAWLDDTRAGQLGPGPDPAGLCSRFGDLASEFRAAAGSITLPAGPGRDPLAPGRLLLIDGGPLAGTVASPAGTVTLVQLGPRSRREIRARVEPGSAGGRLVVASRLELHPSFRNPPMADVFPTGPARPEAQGPTGPGDDAAATADPGDLAVTLTVELGRVNLPLARLAELQPGDVVELARHATEPVDLSSNGRLVARGQLVQVDTELGVRITQVFF